MTITEGETAYIIVITSDADGDDVTVMYPYPFSEGGQWVTEDGDAGEYEFIITATDGQCYSHTIWELTVEEADDSFTLSESVEQIIFETDLEVSDVEVTEYNQEEGYITYEITVENTGYGTYVTDTFMVYTKLETSTSTAFMYNYVNLNQLTQEATFEVTFNVNTKFMSETNGQLTVVADSTDVVSESDEDNNTYTLGSIAVAIASYF
jgi:hypothetical protein